MFNWSEQCLRFLYLGPSPYFMSKSRKPIIFLNVIFLDFMNQKLVPSKWYMARTMPNCINSRGAKGYLPKHIFLTISYYCCMTGGEGLEEAKKNIEQILELSIQWLTPSKGRHQNYLAAASIFSSRLQPNYIGKAIHNC